MPHYVRPYLFAVFAAALPAATNPCFTTNVQPILQAKCAACQGAASPQGKLDLRSPEAILKCGASGPVVGFKAVENRASVHDLHATVLHLLGLNNRELFLDRNGLRERLTDQYPARVVKELLA